MSGSLIAPVATSSSKSSSIGSSSTTPGSSWRAKMIRILHILGVVLPSVPLHRLFRVVKSEYSSFIAAALLSGDLIAGGDPTIKQTSVDL
jgi:hypothetical protein